MERLRWLRGQAPESAANPQFFWRGTVRDVGPDRAAAEPLQDVAAIVAKEGGNGRRSFPRHSVA